MAAVENYTNLIADLQSYLERGGSALTDPTVFNQLPRLINLGERRICNALKLQGQIEPLVNPTNGLSTGVAVITKPDRWRQTISMNYGAPAGALGTGSGVLAAGTGSGLVTALQRYFIYPRSYEYCRIFWPNAALWSTSYPPQFYADYDLLHWLIVPTPPQDYPLEALCYMQPQYLDEQNQTNFWTNYTPNLLLYACLLECTPFLKDDPRVQMWQQLYQEQLQHLDGQDLQKLMDRTSERRAP